ncbi:MAG TPA: nucleoside-diphosphate sugar epimerase [Planctomycetes bacterium]|nr:nucleoside-diphosphate sugar epimerase [Planctomycetota bacterium]
MTTSLRYLLTGGAGFIGSHLADRLLAAGHSVSVIDDLSTGRLENLAHLRDHPRLSFARASIQNETVLDRLSSQADVIVHLAAAVGVQLVVDDPVYTIQANVHGTEDVLKAALRYGCRTLIASTSEVYGKSTELPFEEEADLVLGASSKQRWSYAASKLVDEFLGLAYQRQHGLSVTVFRLFNTVGPRQVGRYGMVIPRLIRQALRGERLTVYGDGTQQRCFCDARDAVRAIEALSQRDDAAGRVYNIGTQHEVSIRALAELIKELCASRSEIALIPYEEAYGPGFEDMPRRVPATERIEALCAWSPELSLEQTLRDTIEYERAALEA